MEDLFELQIVLYKPSFELVIVKCLKKKTKFKLLNLKLWILSSDY